MIVLGCVGLEPWLYGRVPASVLMLGDASYVLYLFHPLAAPAVPAVLKKIGITNGLVSIAGGIAVALTISVLIHLLVERPTNRALKDVGARRPAEAAVRRTP